MGRVVAIEDADHAREDRGQQDRVGAEYRGDGAAADPDMLDHLGEAEAGEHPQGIPGSPVEPLIWETRRGREGEVLSKLRTPVSQNSRRLPLDTAGHRWAGGLGRRLDFAFRSARRRAASHPEGGGVAPTEAVCTPWRWRT